MLGPDCNDWENKLDILTENEQWDTWEERFIAQHGVGEEEPFTDSDEEINLTDSSDEWSKQYFAKRPDRTQHQHPDIFIHPTIPSYSTNKEVIEAYEDTYLHWKEYPVEILLMRMVQELESSHKYFWQILGCELKLRSSEFEAFRQEYAQTKVKSLTITPEATTPPTSANDHYL